MEALNSFFRSVAAAFQGIVYVVRAERNARLHLLIAMAALALGVGMQISNAELAAIFFAIIIVFTAEVVNTALEKTLDLIQPGHSEQVRIIKDVAAGAVLVAAIGAAAIGLAIFLPYLTAFLTRS